MSMFVTILKFRVQGGYSLTSVARTPRLMSYDRVPGAAATKPPPPVIFCQVGVSHIYVTESTPPVIFIPTRVSGGDDFGKLQ